MIALLLLVGIWIQSVASESITISEQTNFEPCSFNNGMLVCDAKNTRNNPNLQFQSPSTKKIERLEIVNFPFVEIPSNYLSLIADNLLSIKIRSIVPIKSIKLDAFTGCSKVTSIEIESQITNETQLDLTDVFRTLESLEHLRLVNLNFIDLQLAYLRKLKSVNIEKSNFKTISYDTFQSNTQLTVLNIVEIKDASSLIDQLSKWPLASHSSITNLKLENCNLKSFPKFAKKFALGLTELSLAKNPIDKIDDSDMMDLMELNVLLLSATKLNNSTMAGLKMLKKLKSIDLSGITTMRDLPKEIELMDSLESINIDMSSGLSDLSITLPASIKKLSAPYLKQGIRISSKLLSQCKQLHFLNFNRLQTTNIKFLVDNVQVFKDSIRILSFDDSVLLRTQLWLVIKDLRNLEILYLNAANIDSIPDEVINNLINLKKLYLSGNQFRYETIATTGFQNVSRHLTDLDLSRNPLIHLPPCLFHGLPSLANVNLLDTGIDCDCNVLWLVERIKTRPVVYPNLNFKCAAGRNKGKLLYELTAMDLQTCSAKIDQCLPSEDGRYDVPFNLVYKSGDSTFRIENINGSYLRFMFDSMKVNVKQQNKVFHSDAHKYNLNQTAIETNHEMQSGVFTVCLSLIRNMKEYNYEYNCQTLMASTVVDANNWIILMGVLGGVGFAIIIIVVLIVVLLCRRSKQKKKSPPQDEMYSEFSSQYSEPNETYQNPDQYTEIISNEEYTLDKKEALMDGSFYVPSQHFYDSNRNLKRLKIPSKSVDRGLDVSYLTNNRSKSHRPRAKSSRYFAKRIPDFSSLHNLNKENNSFPRKYKSAGRSSLQYQYHSRDLPMPPENIPLETQSASPPPPKPKFPSTDIKNLLSNADIHLDYFRNFGSNNSLCTDESANHPHSGDSGLGISKLSSHSQNRLSQDNSVII